MDRRAFLVAAGASALAGCSQFESTENSSTEQTATSSLTGSTQTSKPSSTTKANSVRRDAKEEVIGPNNVGATSGSWSWKESVRYYDDTEEVLKAVKAQNGAFYQIGLRLQNLGGDSIRAPGIDQFSLYAKGEVYSLMDELPNGVSWDSTRQRPETTEIVAPNRGIDNGKIDPGRLLYYTLTYDAPVDTPPVLVWEFEQDGDAIQKYLFTEKHE